MTRISQQQHHHHHHWLLFLFIAIGTNSIIELIRPTSSSPSSFVSLVLLLPVTVVIAEQQTFDVTTTGSSTESAIVDDDNNNNNHNVNDTTKATSCASAVAASQQNTTCPNNNCTTKTATGTTSTGNSSCHNHNHNNNGTTENVTPSSTITLHNGIEMPSLVLGTAQLVSQMGIDATVPNRFIGMIPERTYRQMELALQNQIRAFDTALIYRSHVPMGHVFGEWFRTGQLQHRNELWVQTKIFHPNATQITFGISHMPTLQQMTPQQVSQITLEHVERSLLQLNMGYVDLLLLHWPSGKLNDNDVDDGATTTTTTASGGSNKNNNDTTTIDIDWSLNNEYNNRQRRIAAWRVLEDIYNTKGWVRAIGVSNFSIRHLQQLQQDGATIIPMVNQIEASITIQYTDIVQYCLQNHIVPQAYSPFGRQLTDIPIDLLQTMVERYNKKDYGQIIIKYLLQLGYSVVYLSNSPERMVSNMDVYDFHLSTNDVQTLMEQSRIDGGWGLPSPDQLL